MDLLQKFQQHWVKEFGQLTPGSCRLLLAVSGGVDSVVLVNLVAQMGFHFEIAHCNFQLRGAESIRDEVFVQSLAQGYGKEALVKHFDTSQYALEKKCSIQEAARELRYDWFAEILTYWKQEIDISESRASAYLLTAHHADDNIETMLMHFFRGTGIEGMAGISPVKPLQALIRPMLPCRKADILAWAGQHGLEFVEDSSNASDKYTRNFFRNQLIPQIKEVFPQVEENLLHNMQRFGEAAELYRQSVALHLTKLVEKKGAEVHIPVLKWKMTRPLHTISWELVKPYGFSAAQVDEVIKLFDAGNGSFMASQTHRLIRNRKWIIISPMYTAIAQHILIEEGDRTVEFGNGQLHLAPGDGLPVVKNVSPAEALLDMDLVTYPLLLRKYRQGDYFYPLGMQKKKKISRFLIDLKLSKTEKEKVWVLESNKKIAWVVGHRIDDRFKLTARTARFLHIIS